MINVQILSKYNIFLLTLSPVTVQQQNCPTQRVTGNSLGLAPAFVRRPDRPAHNPFRRREGGEVAALAEAGRAGARVQVASGGGGRAGLSVASLDLVHWLNKASLRGRGAATGAGKGDRGTICSSCGGDAPPPPNLKNRTNTLCFFLCVCARVCSEWIHSPCGVPKPFAPAAECVHDAN